MITQHGLRCDVCGKYILVDRIAESFSVVGITETLHCHTNCRPIVEHAMLENDWELLPIGPLRGAFEAEIVKEVGW